VARRAKKAVQWATTAQRLATVLKTCRDIMRKDKGLSGDVDRLPVLTWIMFLKFLDDMERVRSDEAALEGKPFRPVIDAPYRWRDWNPANSATTDGGLHNAMTGDALIAFISQDEAVRPDGQRGPGLFAHLRSLDGGGATERGDVVASVFRGTVNRMQSGYILRDILNKVSEIHFSSSEEIHTLSRLYESMLREMRDAAGDSGEFYTPRPLVQMIVRAVDPKPGETVRHPAAGTGGFLVEAYDHMRPLAKTVEEFDRLQRSTLYGIEAKPLPFLLCQMSLLLHGVESPHIDPLNALRVRVSEIGDNDRVDVIITNPPFGGEEEKGIQRNFPADRQTSETALLFLQLIMRKLRRPGRNGSCGGRAGVVVPNGILSGDGVAARIKHDLLENFNLHTIVRLPDGVFSPYTPIPTNVLFFDRSGPTNEIWYFEHPLPDARRAYTKTRSLQVEEFEPLHEWWHDRLETAQTWTAPVAVVKANGYNLDLRNPNREDDLAHRPPALLLDEVLRSEQALVALLREMEVSLGQRRDLSDAQKEELGWRQFKLSEVMTPASDPVSVEVDKQYPNVGILSFGRGVFEKAPIDGARTSAKTLYRIKAGQFIYSRLFAFEGAYAAVPPPVDGWYVSNEFPTFDVDNEIADPRFLATYFRSPEIWQQLARSSRGLGVRRQRVHADAVIALTVWLPPRSDQFSVIDQLSRLSGKDGLRARFLDLVGAFEASVLNDLISLAQPTT
jgi:type I restriction enzyme M protein